MDFSDFALAKFLQTAPELGPMILNFTELDEDGGSDDIKTGVFSLRLGTGVAFVPVVAKGDSLFPIDSIFVEEEGQFKPLTKGTITSLLNQVRTAPGKTAKIPNSVDKNPSVYNMINPPRTGKFVYASTSRLSEFLTLLPDHLKQFTFEKISSEKTVYDSLDKIFGLKTIFEVLKPTANLAAAPNTHNAESVSVVTSQRQLGDAFTEAMAKDLIVQGYSVIGNPEFSRVAVAFQPYNTEGTYREVSNGAEGGQDYNIVMKSGSSREVYLPKSSTHNPVRGESLALFTDGSYATALKYIAVGDVPDRETVLKTLFEISPPKLPKDCNRSDHIIMFTSEGEYLGPFYVNSVVQNHMGTEMGVSCFNNRSEGGRDYSATLTKGVNKICAYRNHTKDLSKIGDTLFVPSTIVVLTLGSDLSQEIERSAHDALMKKELITSQYLGAELNLRFDGVEYSGNGHVWGTKAAAMKNLVEVENLEPSVAETFLKQAELTKSVKIFLSKQAASQFTPAEVPQFGNLLDDHSKKVGLNGSFMPSVQEASRLGDGQVLEATIISQLLQVPDLFEYIEEYLPELSGAVDKLGRILFLTRTKLSQLSENLDPDSVFALVSQLKTVYRQLGDSVEKLKEISITSKGFKPDTENTQDSGD